MMTSKNFRRCISLALALCLALALGACSVKIATFLRAKINDAIVDKEYDFEPNILKRTNYTYKISAKYADGATVSVNGLRFTPKKAKNISVTLTSTYEENVYNENCVVVVKPVGGGDIDPPIDPPIGEERDLSCMPGVCSPQVPPWGAESHLSVETGVVSTASERSLKGRFNYQEGNPYEGNKVWTWVDINFMIAYGDAINISDKCLSMDIKLQNTDTTSSIIMFDTNENQSNERQYDILRGASSVNVKSIGNGWSNIRIELTSFFLGDNGLNNPYDKSQIKHLLVMFSNVNQNVFQDSVYYMDNIYICDKTESDVPKPIDPPVHNPSGYYDKNQVLSVMIAGNSFIGTSKTMEILQSIATENRALMNFNMRSIGYGRIANQITEAFHPTEGYMLGGAFDVIVLQDFYGEEDTQNMRVFLEKLGDIRDTEVKIYPAENESNDGARSAELYGLDLIDWKGLINRLKHSGYTNYDLNFSDEILHANEISGFAGACLIYMNLYGEVPVLGQTIVSVLDIFHGESYLGGTRGEKVQSLESIAAHARDYAGL